MSAELLRILGLAPDLLDGFVLVFLRIGAALFVLPVFGETMIPQRVRLAVAFALAAATFPAVLPGIVQDTTPLLLRGLAEVVTGLAIGLLLRIQVMAIQIAATIAAQATSLSQLLGNASVDPQPAMGVVLYIAALALAVELGLHVRIVVMFVESYAFVGAGTLIGGDLAIPFREAVSASFRLAFVLAAPFVAMSMLYNLALGVINRAMPQLMVAFVGAPAITWGALLLLALTAPLMLSLWAAALDARIHNPFGAR